MLVFWYSRTSCRVSVTDEANVADIVGEFPELHRKLNPETKTLIITVSDLAKVVARYVPMGYTIHVEQTS